MVDIGTCWSWVDVVDGIQCPIPLNNISIFSEMLLEKERLFNIFQMALPHFPVIISDTDSNYTNPHQFFVTFIFRFILLHRFHHRIIVNSTCGVV